MPKKTAKKLPNKYKYVFNPDCPEVTMNELNDWYKDVFQQLGWIVLASSSGMTDKVMAYVASIERLECAITKKTGYYDTGNERRDLDILLQNVKMLKDFVNETFTTTGWLW